MVKVYLLNQRRNNSTFLIHGTGGNTVQYNFKGGSVINNQPATYVTGNEYFQFLLENSELFKKGVVKLDPRSKKQAEMEAKAKAEKEARLASMEKVEDVKNAEQAITYIAERFGEKVTSAKKAAEVAEKNGVIFPNLKVGKK